MFDSDSETSDNEESYNELVNNQNLYFCYKYISNGFQRV